VIGASEVEALERIIAVDPLHHLQTAGWTLRRTGIANRVGELKGVDVEKLCRRLHGEGVVEFNFCDVYDDHGSMVVDYAGDQRASYSKDVDRRPCDAQVCGNSPMSPLSPPLSLPAI